MFVLSSQYSLSQLIAFLANVLEYKRLGRHSSNEKARNLGFLFGRVGFLHYYLHAFE